MTVKEFAEKLNLRVLAGTSGLDNEVSGCYICDLLSWVMSHSSKGDAWITVHTHLNVMAVAVLMEHACIIIPEDITIEKETLQKSDEEGIPMLGSPLNAYELACKIKEAGIKNA